MILLFCGLRSFFADNFSFQISLSATYVEQSLYFHVFIVTIKGQIWYLWAEMERFNLDLYAHARRKADILHISCVPKEKLWYKTLLGAGRGGRLA